MPQINFRNEVKSVWLSSSRLGQIVHLKKKGNFNHIQPQGHLGWQATLELAQYTVGFKARSSTLQTEIQEQKRPNI